MTRKFTFLMTAMALIFAIMGPRSVAWGQETYERLTSIADIDESAEYVLGIDGTGFHYEGTSSWGKTALPSAKTPLYYTLKKAADGLSFTAQTTISNSTYYLQVPTSNTFGMTTSTGTNTDLIIGTTQENAGDDKGYAVANKSTAARHLRRNGDSGLRSYAGNTGALAFFYKVVKDDKTLISVAVSGTPTKTTYEAGEEFDPAGLIVTGTFDDASAETISSGITWNATPKPLTDGTTSVSVTATVSGITSPAYQVNGLTVTEHVQTYANTYTSNVELTTAGGTSASTAKVKWKNVEYNALKCGTSSAAGVCIVSIPANTQTLHFHAAGWNNEDVELNETFNLVADAGVSNNSPFTLQNDPEESDYFTLNPQGATSITFTATSGKRFVLFGVNAEEGPIATLQSISIKTAPTKVTYTEGECFDPTGLVITKHYVEDEAADEDVAYSAETASQFTFVPTLATSLVTSNTQVEITIGEKSTIQAIIVTEAPKYTATTSINGITNSTPDITEFTLTQATAPSGFDFAGWTTAENDVDPTHFVSGTVQLTANTTFYAVFSRVEGGTQGAGDYVKITSTPTDWSGEYLLVATNNSNNYAFNNTISNDWGKFEIVSISDNVIERTEEIESFEITIGETATPELYYLQISSGEYLKASAKGKFNKTTTQDDDTSFQFIANEDGEIEIVSSSHEGRTIQFNYNAGNGGFRFYDNGSQIIPALYKKNAGTPGTTHYYTRVFLIETATANINIGGPSIIPAGSTLDMSTFTLGNTTAANLIIEDGGQLIHSNDGVQATMRKEVAAYSTTEGVNDSWYFVASPMATLTSHNLNNGTFDLYKFEQTADKEWKNYESTNFSITNKEGYLYANAANTTIEFVGTLNATDGSKTLAYEDVRLAGFNLIGNPFACNANIGTQDFYICDGESITLAENSTIAPCTGIMVKANATGESVTFVKGEETTRDINAMDITIAKATRNANTMDRARINFSGDSQLSKFFFNENSCLYISQNGDDFAVVAAQAQGELPVNFKAEKNGSYTITVNTENVKAEYLHLIDNMTGMDTDLLSTPSYTFEAKTSDYASRFKLVFNVKNEEANSSSDNNFAFMSDGNLVISNIEGEATLQIVDQLGRVLSTETVSGSYNKALNLKAGLYILNLNGMTQKIVVK